MNPLQEPGAIPAGSPAAAAAYLGALIQGLAQSGVGHLVFCPGSRSTPVLLAAQASGSLRLWQHVDERSAAFFGLGLARSLGEPVALLATSGTAAVNFHPAVTEARYGRVPLVVLTADRPRELREVGAPQTIDQTGLYGSHAKLSLDLPLPEASSRMRRHAFATAVRAVAVAREAPAGPVHLNLPLREPLLLPQPGTPDAPEGPAGPEGTAQSPSLPPPVGIQAGGRTLEPQALAALAGTLGTIRRGLVVVGPQEDPVLAEAALRLATRLGWPVLADPLSQLRSMPLPDGRAELVITTYDAFLRVPAAFQRLQPQGILRLGAAPVSKALGQYLEHHAGVPQWLVDEAPAWRDPGQVATQVIWAEPRRLIQALEASLPARTETDGLWLELWRRLEEESARVLDRAVPEGDAGSLFEGRIVPELVPLLPEGSLLFAGNSMPVRDLDTFQRPLGRRLRMMANRGASGIDGVVSTALGAAAAGRSGPVVLVVGDLSFYHDLNGLLAARLHRIPLTVVLIQNDGGGIFSFLPQASLGPLFEPLFGTPTGLDFRPAVEMYGGRFLRPEGWPAFRQAIRQALDSDGLTVVEVRSDRQRNVLQHRQLWQRVQDAVTPLLEGGAP